MDSALSSADRVKLLYRLVDDKKVDDLIALFDVDAVYRRPGYAPFCGREALREFYAKERVIIDGLHIVNVLVAQGDSIAAQGSFQGILKSGREVRLRFADFFLIGVDGCFTQRDTFFFTPLV